MFFRTSLSLLIVVSLGCGKTESPKVADVEPVDVAITEADVKMPATYKEALPQIKSYRDAIRSVIESGTPSKAHRALDELDIVLDNLPSIAKGSGVPKEQWETVNMSAQALRNLFNQVHSAIDAKREPGFKAVADPIDEAIAKLEKVAQ